MSTQAELVDVLDRYYAALAAGDFGGFLALSTEEVRAMTAEEFPSEEARREAVEFLKLMVPLRYEVLRLDTAEEDSASLLVRATILTPPETEGAERVEQTSEVIVRFAREGGAWKVGRLLWGVPEADVQVVEDEEWEPADAYRSDLYSSCGGRIVRANLEGEHPRLILRVLDQEVVMFLPDVAYLRESGFDIGLLVPHAMVEAEVLPHRTNPGKCLMKSLRVQ